MDQYFHYPSPNIALDRFNIPPRTRAIREFEDFVRFNVSTYFNKLWYMCNSFAIQIYSKKIKLTFEDSICMLFFHFVCQSMNHNGNNRQKKVSQWMPLNFKKFWQKKRDKFAYFIMLQFFFFNFYCSKTRTKYYFLKENSYFLRTWEIRHKILNM